jgi:hypothetical protein
VVDLAVRTRASALGEDRARNVPAGPGHHDPTAPDLQWLPRDQHGSLLPRIEVQFFSFSSASPSKPYAYAWGGTEQLEVGDIVIAPRPPNWTGPHVGVAKVVALGSRYEGPVRIITELFTKRR